MRENKVQTIFRAGGAVINGWLAIPNSFSAEVMAHTGFDSITIDMQHGAMHYDAAFPMLQAISSSEATPLARVPWNEPGIIGKMLDAGCYGIICPMINNRAESEAFVRACKYPPIGSRSNGPTRGRYYGGSDYVLRANETILAMAMVETAEAMKNLDAILSTPGLDGVYVGPADLSISLKNGMPPEPQNEAVMEACKLVVAGCKKYNIIPGIHCMSTQHTTQMIEMGFRFVTIQSDVVFLSNYASNAVAEVRKTASANSKGEARMY